VSEQGETEAKPVAAMDWARKRTTVPLHKAESGSEDDEDDGRRWREGVTQGEEQRAFYLEVSKDEEEKSGNR